MSYGQVPDYGHFAMHVANYRDDEGPAWTGRGYRIELWPGSDEENAITHAMATGNETISHPSLLPSGKVRYSVGSIYGLWRLIVALTRQAEDDLGPQESDENEFVFGNDENAVYWTVSRDPDSGQWFAQPWIDAESFTHDLPRLGPFATRQEAIDAGFYQASDWCMENDAMPTSAGQDMASSIMTTLGYEWV